MFFAVHSVLEISIFTRWVDALLSRAERMDLIATLARNPEAGDVIPESAVSASCGLRQPVEAKAVPSE